MGRRLWNQRNRAANFAFLGGLLSSPSLGRLLFCGGDAAGCAGRSTPRGCRCGADAAGCAGRWRGGAPAAGCAGRLTPRGCRHGADATGCAGRSTPPPCGCRRGRVSWQRCLFLEGAGVGLRQLCLGGPARAAGRIRTSSRSGRKGPKSCAMCATARPCPRRRKRRRGPGGPPMAVCGRVCGLGWALGTRARRRKELCEGQWTRLGLRSSYLFSYPCSLSLFSLSPSLPLFLARSLEYVCAQDWLSPRSFPPRVCLLLGRTLSLPLSRFSLSVSLSVSLSLSLSLCLCPCPVFVTVCVSLSLRPCVRISASPSLRQSLFPFRNADDARLCPC